MLVDVVEVLVDEVENVVVVVFDGLIDEVEDVLEVVLEIALEVVLFHHRGQVAVPDSEAGDLRRLEFQEPRASQRPWPPHQTKENLEQPSRSSGMELWQVLIVRRFQQGIQLGYELHICQ